MGGTNLRYTPDGQYGNNQHITGTMAMGDDAKDSVVDRFGRTHDHQNLVHRQHRRDAYRRNSQFNLDRSGAVTTNAQHIQETT